MMGLPEFVVMLCASALLPIPDDQYGRMLESGGSRSSSKEGLL